MINREFEHATLCKVFGHCNAFSVLSVKRDTRHCSCFSKVTVFSAKNCTADGVVQNRHISSSVELLVDLYILSTAIGLTPGGSSTVHIYTRTVHITTQITTEQHK